MSIGQGYIGVPIVTDPAQLAADALDYLTSNLPGFTPQEGHLTVWLALALARIASRARDVASATPTAIFRYFGRNVLDLQPEQAAPALLTAQWTAQDTNGYVVPRGSLAGWAASGSNLVAFQTVVDLTIAAGSLTGTVQMQAVTPGVAGNGLGPGAMTPIDTFAFISAISATAASAGGVDAESDASYLNRLSQELQTIAPRPILPGDFSILARNVPGVHRATTIDLYNPADDTTNNERMVTVVGVDAAGAALASAVKTALKAYFQARREVNFVANVADPAFTTINVNFTATSFAGATASQVQADAIAALTAYLSPANWAGGDQDPPVWAAGETSVRYLEVATVLNNVPGLNHVTALTLNGGTADVALTGVAPLPTVGAIVGTVT